MISVWLGFESNPKFRAALNIYLHPGTRWIVPELIKYSSLYAFMTLWLIKAQI
jgi:hypothetical protein